MRSLLFSTTLLLLVQALGATEPNDQRCVITMKSTYELTAPYGWKFVDCCSGIRSQQPNFWLEPDDPALGKASELDPYGIAMFGGPVGPGTVAASIEGDRQGYPAFEKSDGEALRTADHREVRVLHLAIRDSMRGGRYTWMALGYFQVGPSVFWLQFDCRREEYCADKYDAFKNLVRGIRVVAPSKGTG